ncbi:uncharacterized protein LOC127509984 isoform X2 [Ctenopharyngodon idella]|uniref:uncharacterized protein LOC127509984 isoform X2 n=1 Tax=Ctenopharyngodon idella TaxID=7959 RepID=UPI002230BD33|nr:uncharacterized protein LOC127509984 isoform X2 [Ctenopharyngodon idella]
MYPQTGVAVKLQERWKKNMLVQRVGDEMTMQADEQEIQDKDKEEKENQDKDKGELNTADLDTRSGTADEASDIIYTKQLRKGPPSADFTVSSDVNKKLLKLTTWKLKKETEKKPRFHLASANVDLVETINIIDTFDRPGAASAEGTYAGSGTYAVAFEGEPGKRIPKAGAYAEAGVGRASAEFSVFEAEAKGPNVSAGAEANMVGAGAMARAEVASASAKAGPVGVKVGLGLDTGATVGPTGAEVKVLGTGFSVGLKNSISLLGSEVSCSVM